MTSPSSVLLDGAAQRSGPHLMFACAEAVRVKGDSDARIDSHGKRYLANLRRERGVDDRAGARLEGKGGRVGLTFDPALADS